jgi:serine/threonine-protein kinase
MDRPALPSGLADLFRRFGPPVRFAVEQLLAVLLPGDPPLAGLVAGVLDAVAATGPGQFAAAEARLDGLSAADRDRVEEVVRVLADELGTLVAQVAALEGMPAAARQVIAAALAADARCRAAADRVGQLARQPAPAATRPPGEAATRLEDAEPPAAMVFLEVVEGPHRGLRYETDRHDTLVVGRAPTAGLQLLDDAYFSRHHFLVEFNPPRCFLRDLGSSNGTRVNGEKVTERFLQDGDVISGGRTRIRLSLPAAARPDTVPPSTRGGGVGTEDPTVPPATLEPAAASPGPVPGYEVLGELGRGGMGVVYRARRQGTAEPVALKVILPESAASEAMMRRFLREVSVLSQLDHPRIVRFKEMGTAAGQFFFVMEYVEAIDVRARLAALPGPVRVRALCGLACQVLQGLAYAHQRGFVHRDVKPQNVLVSEEAGKLRARLADFGLAKSFENAGLSGMTHDGEVVGTVAFMAPEQVTCARTARPAVDLYAAGATLYYLLADRLPYDFGTGKVAVAVLLEDAAVPLTRVCPDAPPGLADVIHRALAKDPAARHPTAEALREALLPYSRAPGKGGARS